MADKPFYMMLNKEKVNNDILNVIPFFDVLSQKKKTFLIQVYIKSYTHGVQAIRKDAFINKNSITCQELKDRFYNFSDIKDKNLDFITKLAAEDETSLDAILEESTNQDDFIYDIYESNYIDKSLDVLHSIVIPKEFEDIDIHLVSQDAFADGAMNKIDFLAKNSMVKWATKMVEEM